ncbi:MAG: lipase/acyltransferase domain-containing protein [Acidimicrobiales bacterium]
MKRRFVAALVAVVTLLASIGAFAAPAEARRPVPIRRPVIFVHGFVGSGGQFESQAQRFASNGYPAGLIAAQEYDSTFGTITMDGVWTQLDGLITTLLAQSGADKVELVGHSLGTAVSQGFLNSSPERAARVAHYVNLDGAPADALPGGVATLAVWGEGNSGAQVVGATNVYQPDHSHVQVATSAETFDAMYRFFNNDQAPATTDIRPQHRVLISGRVDLFPTNAGADGTTLEIWEVDRATGFRKRSAPEATFAIGADGSWGPFQTRAGRYYELAVRWSTSTQHFYYEPFVREDRLVRLLTQPPGTGLDGLREKSPDTANLLFVRYKELWGDQSGQSDVLTVDGTNVLTPAIAPRAKRLNALFAFDVGLDGVTDLSAPIPALNALPFISGADVYIPSSPTGTIHLALTPRGGGGEVETLNVPSWPSSTDFVSVQFRDWVRPVT